MIEPILNVARCLACNAVLTTDGPPGPLCPLCFEKHYGELMLEWQRIVHDHAYLIRAIYHEVDSVYPFGRPVAHIAKLLSEGRVLQPRSMAKYDDSLGGEQCT